MDDAKQAHDRLYLALKNVPPANVEIDWEDKFAARFKNALDDDFNTPEAMAVLFDLANEANKTKNSNVSGLMKKLGGILGLLTLDAEPYLQGIRQVTLALTGVGVTSQIGNVSKKTIVNVSGEDKDIEEVIQNRLDAKKAKNFAEADRIRKELADAGIILEDTPQGTTWRRA